jgi:hypothetical protein
MQSPGKRREEIEAFNGYALTFLSKPDTLELAVRNTSGIGERQKQRDGNS